MEFGESRQRGGRSPTDARAHAAIDRFTSNAYDLVMEGESYRTRLKPGRRTGQNEPKSGK